MARLEHKSSIFASPKFWWLTITRRALKHNISRVLFKMYLAQTFGQINSNWPPQKMGPESTYQDKQPNSTSRHIPWYRSWIWPMLQASLYGTGWRSPSFVQLTFNPRCRKPWDMKVNMACIGSLRYLKIKDWKIWTNKELLALFLKLFWLEIHIGRGKPRTFVEQHVFDFRSLQRLLCVSGPYNDSDGMVDAFTIRCGWCSPNSQSWKWFSLWSFSNLHHVKWIKVFGSLDVWGMERNGTIWNL